MKHLNFLSKSGSWSMGHRVTTLASTVGSPSVHRRGIMLKLIFLAMLFLIAGIGNVWGANWNKITNLSDLSNGDSILVVIQDGKTLTSGKAFKVGGTTSANSVDVTITSNSYISDPANNTKWAVNRSTSNNITTYTFTNGNSNKIATGSTSNGNIGGNGGTYYTWYLTKLSDGYFKVQYGNSSGMYISWKGSCFGKYANSSFVNQMTLSTKVNLAANHGAISFYKKAASTTPTITKSSEMTTLTYSNGSPVAQYFTVGGTNLTNNVTVTAPANGKYEVSTSQNSGYGNSVELSKGNGTLANTNVYIRLKSGLAGGNISADNISITSTGATVQTIAVTGSVPYTITWMANGSEHATTYVAVGGTLALPASNPVPNTCGCTGKTFYGWYGGASYSHASTAPSIAAAGNAVNADKTYHAVFADEGEEETPDPITQTLTVGSNGGTWPATGNKMSSAKVGDVTFTALGSGTNDGKYYTTDNSWRFYTNSTSGIKVSVPSGGIITKVKITWKTTIPATPSGWSRNQTTSPTTYTPNSGTEVNEVSFTKTSSGNVFFQVIEVTYTPAGGGTTYTNFETTCCTPLAQINGSVNLSQLETPEEGKLEAAWQLAGINGIESLKLQLWKKGATANDDVQVGNDVAVDVNTNAQTHTFTGLDYCATYYAKLIAAKDGGTYCTNGWTETSNEATTIGYAITLPANGKVMDGQTEMGTVTSSATRACAGDQVTLTATPTSPYTGGAIVVKKTSDDTNVTSDYFNAGTGKLTMPAFGVTISATFTAPTQPSLSATGEVLNENELAFGNQEKNVQSAGKTFTISGLNLTANVTWALSGTDASMFSVSPASPIAQATAEAGQAIMVKFTPTSTGDKTATLTFSSTGAADKVINLTGTGIELYTISLNAGTGAVSTEGWTLNNGVYTKKQAALNEEITLPTATVGAQGWSFLGWAASSVSQATNNEPTLQATTFTPGSSTTFYAVYRKTITEGGTSQIKMSYGSVEGWTISEGVTGTSYYFLKKDEYIESPEIADMSAISSIKVTVGAYNNAGAYKIEAGGTQIISDTKPGSSSIDRTYNATTYFPALSGTGKIRLTNTDGVVQSNSQPSGTRMHAMTINIDVAAVYSYHSTPASATGLAVQVAPTKTVYKVGDTFDPAGTTLRVTYSNSTTEDITSGFTYSPTTALTKENTSVTFSYLGLNCNQAISVLDPVATPTFSPASGSEVNVSETITISCETASATIYYTTDGSDPTNTSAVYSTPIAPYSTIKAIAMKAGMAPSEIATATYTVVKNSQTLSFTNSSYSFRLNSDEYNAFEHQAVSGAVTTVTYSSSNTAVADIEGGVVVLKGGKGTATITATAAETATYSSASATYTITVLRAGVTRTGDFVLVTDVNDLAEGDYVILTEEDDDNPYVFSGISTSNAGTVQVKNAANDVITYSQFTAEGNEAKIIYLEKVGDYWAFNYGTESDVYIAAGTSTGSGAAALRGLEEIDDYCKWDISFDGKNAIAENQGNSTYPRLSFNSSAVKSYKTKQSGGLRIYKQQDRNLTPQTLSFETASYEFPLNESGYTSFTHQAVSGAQTAVTYTSGNTDVAAIVNNEVVLQGKVGTATITATAEADETYQTASATYTITVTAALRTVTFHYYKPADATADQTALKEESSGAGITVPANPANVGEYTFLGWAPATLAETQTAPNNLVAALQAGATYHPTGDEEYFAIYRRLENSDGRFYLMHEVSSTPNYAKAPVGNEFGNTTDIAQAAKFVQTEDNKLYYYNGSTPTYIAGTHQGSGADGRALDFTTNEAEALVWTITENGQIVSYFDSNTEKYFAHNNTMWAAYASSSITQVNQSKDLTKVYLSHVYYSSTPNLMVSPVLTWAQGNETHVMEIEETYDNAATATVGGEPVSVTYASSDPNKATVSETGVVTAILGGDVTITATVAAEAGVNRELVESYQVSITKKVPQIVFDDNANWKVYVGETYKRVLAGQVTITTDGAVTYTLSNNATSSDWASINSETGEVTGLSTGGQISKFQNFYVHTAETDMYQSGVAYKQFNVLALKNQTLTFGQNAYVFDMNETVAPFVNTLSGNQTAVAYGSDNTDVAEVDEASGEVTVHTNVCGVATITATAAEGYSGTDVYNQATQSYTITVNYPMPTFSMESSNIKAPVSLAISGYDENTKLYYTDGEGDPATLYSEPLAISATKTIRAKATNADGSLVSPIASVTLTKVTPTVTGTQDGGTITLSSDENSLITYIILNQNAVTVAEGTDVPTPVVFETELSGTYTVSASAKWDVENGFTGEDYDDDFTVKGKGHLPISYTGDGSGLDDEAWATKVGYVGNYTSGDLLIKFSDSEQALIAAFVEKPVQLSYSIKHMAASNKAWETTSNVYSVQWSADGETYNDIVVYNASHPMSKDEITSEIFDLDPSARYIKWIYDTKTQTTGGNVALGNIRITCEAVVIDGISVVDIPEGYDGDVVVEEGVTWVPVNNDFTPVVNNLWVKQGAVVDLSMAMLEVNDLRIEAMEGYSGQILEQENFSITGNAYYDLTLNTSGTMDNSKWYAFAVPFQVDAATGIQRLSNDGVASNAGFNSHYVLLKYNSAAYASAGQGWEYVTRGETLEPGKFYMIALNSNAYNRVRMTKKAGSPVNNKANLTLSTVGTGMHANWNALANNALAYANVSASGLNADLKVQVYNSAEDSYTAYEYGKVTFTVGTPFFIQVAEAGTMNVDIAATYNETVKAPARYTATTEEFKLRLGADTESFYDQLYVSASDEALNEYQIGHDLAKAGVSTTVPQMYIPAYGAKLCDAEFPLVNNEATFPLTFTAPSAGTYQLYISKAATDAELFLTKDGSVIWNLSTGAYALTLEKGTTENYGLLLKAAKTPTGVDEPTSDSSLKGRATKVVIDEHVYILRGGQMYDVTGKIVK